MHSLHAQVRADRIQFDLEELMKGLTERCKKHGIDIKSTAVIELPIGNFTTRLFFVRLLVSFNNIKLAIFFFTFIFYGFTSSRSLIETDSCVGCILQLKFL